MTPEQFPDAFPGASVLPRVVPMLGKMRRCVVCSGGTAAMMATNLRPIHERCVAAWSQRESGETPTGTPRGAYARRRRKN